MSDIQFSLEEGHWRSGDILHLKKHSRYPFSGLAPICCLGDDCNFYNTEKWLHTAWTNVCLFFFSILPISTIIMVIVVDENPHSGVAMRLGLKEPSYSSEVKCLRLLKSISFSLPALKHPIRQVAIFFLNAFLHLMRFKAGRMVPAFSSWSKKSLRLAGKNACWKREGRLTAFAETVFKLLFPFIHLNSAAVWNHFFSWLPSVVAIVLSADKHTITQPRLTKKKKKGKKRKENSHISFSRAASIC